MTGTWVWSSPPDNFVIGRPETFTAVSHRYSEGGLCLNRDSSVFPHHASILSLGILRNQDPTLWIKITGATVQNSLLQISHLVS